MKRPNPTSGMRHVALYVADMGAAEHFYVELLGMTVEWRPDANNVYLTSGNDNVALHSSPEGYDTSGDQSLDHIGYILETMQDVDDWFEFLRANGVKMKTEPRTHRDGARSFYCLDPDGNTVQMIFHPPLVGQG
ncbi:VOC family protein [Candidatus Reidiella endopervernicosa]|uniref:VOC family protein n=1 Tax=Candidatus Reidiella endopervernicosa TaxID=2738883 RepID=A0A6N0I157_9GAMM|nr:VOC family protein [Candidatus Reidiella endopervernicosa]QKQ28358.1 VOC family protein [Candidatus Reidiella endopervernicosa]